MDNQQTSSGFPPHLQNQLDQASRHVHQAQRGRGGGRVSRGRNYFMQQPYQHQHPYQAAPPPLDAFPPLGTNQTTPSGPSSTLSSASSQPHSAHPHGAPVRGYHHHTTPRQFFDNSRGFDPFGTQGQYNPQPPRQFHGTYDDFRRRPAPHGILYQQQYAQPASHGWPSNADQQRSFRHQVMAQADYLNRLQQEARNKYQLKHDEQVAKENFRKRLELFCQETLTKQYPELDASAVRLKCYGSLNNGFGLAGCDMDLLLALPDGFTPPTIALPARKVKTTEEDSRNAPSASEDVLASDDVPEPAEQENFAVGWLLEGALLDRSLGARLLTKTRVPILKICESPSDDLLRKLRQCRSDQIASHTPSTAPSVSESTLPPDLDISDLTVALSSLEDQDSAAGVALPDSQPQSKHTTTDLEFGDASGIKCDVNFTNNMALFNTRLLREYCMLDPRVAQVGVFVKTWTKTRDINTPYYGTLSSYGYVLMVLHFLMNIVQPPVIPNLQHLAREEDAWNQRETVNLFDGKYDVRFLTDSATIAQYRNAMSQNKDSIGNLIRGFFWYYSNKDGFNWKNDVVSIRTKGGIMKKFSKGWTEAKWSDQGDQKNVRLRYLMAIEDPFETEHNVARVVGHNGIVAIRDEFRRAWSIISSVGVEGVIAEDLMKPVEARGDLLRKDQDHHKEKMKQMKQAAEAKQRESLAGTSSDNGQANGQLHANGTSSDSDSSSKPLPLLPENLPDTEPKLTPWARTYRDKPRQWSSRKRNVKEDTDDEDGDEDEKENEARKNVEMNRSVGVTEERTPENPGPADVITEAVVAELNMEPGFDIWGNPVAWDVGTQEGRWLQWRDNKIRAGQSFDYFKSEFARVHAACPFDPRRPVSLTSVHSYRPPVSMSSSDAAEKTTSNQRLPPRSRNELPIRQWEEQVDTPQDDVVKAGVSVSDQEQPPSIISTAANVTTPDSGDKPVKLPIRYNRFSDGGRWLMKRDALVRQGKLVVEELGDWEQRLHNEIPYNPHMKFSELQELNLKLKIHWKRRPKLTAPTLGLTAVQTTDQSPVSNVKASMDHVLAELKELPSQREQGQYSLPGNTADGAVQVEESDIPETEIRIADQNAHQDNDPEDMPNSTFIRSRRLTFFAQQRAKDASSQKVASDKQAETVQSLMRNAGIDVNRPNLTKTESAMGIWADSDSEKAEGKTRTAAQTSFQSNTTTAVELKSSLKSSHATVDSSQMTDVASEDSEKVPSTLLPNMSTEERPRDEDPNVMPIPRNMGFKFDVRQLRDLAVIKEGGNGCARAGHEFEIEEDYEWGGGGEMGYKTSSGMGQTSGNTNDTYEYGQGDDEGLLNELPGDIDCD